MDLEQKSTRAQILSYLKKRGELSVNQLSEALGISPMGVRQHLSVLERDAMIVVRQRRRAEGGRGGAGRPGYVYSLSEKADEGFPRNYDALAQMLLQSAEELYGAGAAEAILRRRMEKLSDSLSARLVGPSPEDRLRQLAEAQEAAGYMAKADESPEGFRLCEHNCAIARVARTYPQACRYELELFRRLIDPNLTRRRCISDGDSCCEYILVKDEG